MGTYHKDSGVNSLFTAIRQGKAQKVKSILPKVTAADNLNCECDGNSFLDFAVYYGHLDIVKMLVELQSPLLSLKHKDTLGLTPLDKASLYQLDDIYSYLQNMGGIHSSYFYELISNNTTLSTIRRQRLSVLNNHIKLPNWIRNIILKMKLRKQYKQLNSLTAPIKPIKINTRKN